MAKHFQVSCAQSFGILQTSARHVWLLNSSECFINRAPIQTIQVASELLQKTRSLPPPIEWPSGWESAPSPIPAFIQFPLNHCAAVEVRNWGHRGEKMGNPILAAFLTLHCFRRPQKFACAATANVCVVCPPPAAASSPAFRHQTTHSKQLLVAKPVRGGERQQRQRQLATNTYWAITLQPTNYPLLLITLPPAFGPQIVAVLCCAFVSVLPLQSSAPLPSPMAKPIVHRRLIYASFCWSSI